MPTPQRIFASDNLRARRFYERYAGQVIAEREDVRDRAVLLEWAYGWSDLKELDHWSLMNNGDNSSDS
jgi:hypothetical protein